MKKLSIALLIAFTAFSCVSKKSADRITEQKDSLANVLLAKDSIINDVFTSLNEITENLNTIKTKENILSNNLNGDIKKTPTAVIKEDIAALNELIEQNKATIASLKDSAAKLRKANVKIGELEKLISSLNYQIEQKNKDIATLENKVQSLTKDVANLTGEVKDLNTEVEGLKGANTELKENVKQKTYALNKAFYIVGKEKELVANSLVVKSGFIGRTLKLNDKYSDDLLTQINIENFESVVIGHKKIQIVTSHPESSYELVYGDNGVCEMLKIKNKDLFWSVSKVLVVSYK